MQKIVVHRLEDLRPGDQITGHGGRPCRRPLRVTAALGPIEPGSPVRGVRVESPNPASGVEWVLYPAQMDGRAMDVERPD
jgi:hypothetical protein